MALTFQNAESIKQALFEELQNIMSSNAEIRNSAENRIKQLEFTEGYGVYLAEFIMNQSFDLALRQLACIMLTKYVDNHWGETESNTKDGIASEQVKKSIRNILPNGLYDPNSKIRSVVAQTISSIASWDLPNVWTELSDIIIKCLGGNENSIHGAMQVLIEFPYDDKLIKNIGPTIISEVYRIFDADQVYSLKTRTHALKILKPLFQSISYNVINKQEQAAMMGSILTNITEKLIHNLSINSGSNFALKTEIVKILTLLVTEMPKYINPFINQILPPIWQLLTQTADVYVKVMVNGIEPNPFPESDDDEDDELTNFTTMIIQIFEFIQCVIGSGKFRSIIKPVLTDLIYIMIVYIQVTEEQISMWEDDPEKFVEDEDDAGVDLTIRLSGQDVLTALNDEFHVKTFSPLSEALTRHMNVAEAEKTSGNPNWWKIYEASMVAVHTFKELIMENEEKFDLLNYLTLIRNLLNFQSSPHLLGRCLWTLSAYSKSNLYNSQMLSEILDVTLNSLNRDKPIVLKICAVRAIHDFVENLNKCNDEKHHLIVSKLASFVDGILDLISGCKSSVLALLLEALTSILSFDNNFAASVNGKVIPLTIAIFLKYPEDPFILEIVQDMLKVLSQNPLCLLPLQEKIIPTLVSILNLQCENITSAKQDIALDVLTTIVRYSQPPLSENLIENAFPAVVHCILRTDDHSVMVSGGECLRAYIFVSPEQVCSYKNGEGLNYIMQITTMLLNPMNTELTAQQIGRLVITIVTKMGNILGENIDLLLKAVISKMQLAECLKVMMSLVVIFAHLFLTQMDAVLNFLTTVPGPTGEPAIQFVISNWLSKQTLFFGAYERKVTTMALCKLFEYGVTTKDNRLTSISVNEQVINNAMDTRMRTRQANSNQSNSFVQIPAIVKIFKLLINELGHLKEAKLAGDDNDSTDQWTDEENDENSEKNTSGTGGKLRFTSDLYFNDEDDENSDDDQLTQELLKDPLFQADMEVNLTKFLQNFSSNEHFRVFVEQLNENEKVILKGIQVDV